MPDIITAWVQGAWEGISHPSHNFSHASVMNGYFTCSPPPLLCSHQPKDFLCSIESEGFKAEAFIRCPWNAFLLPELLHNHDWSTYLSSHKTPFPVHRLGSQANVCSEALRCKPQHGTHEGHVLSCCHCLPWSFHANNCNGFSNTVRCKSEF